MQINLKTQMVTVEAPISLYAKVRCKLLQLSASCYLCLSLQAEGARWVLCKTHAADLVQHSNASRVSSHRRCDVQTGILSVTKVSLDRAATACPTCLTQVKVKTT